MMGVCCVEGYRSGDMVIEAVMVVYVESMVKSLGTVVLGDVVLVSAMLISIVSGDLVMEGGVVLVSTMWWAIVSEDVVSRAIVVVSTVSRVIVAWDVVLGTAVRGGICK